MLLTIAIPIFNGGKTIEMTLRSIVDQIEKEVEIVISDNCSTDNTVEIVNKYMLTYSNIKYFKNNENVGPDNNFDLALRRATNEYVWFIGDDDILLPGAINRVLDVIKNNTDVDYFFGNCSIWNKDFTKCKSKKFIPVENDVKCETADNFFSIIGVNAALTPTTIIRQSFWIESKETPYMGTNWGLLSKLFHILINHKTYIISQILVKFRDGSERTHKDGKFYEMSLVLLTLIELLPTLGYSKETYQKVRKPLLDNMLITIAFEKRNGLKVTRKLLITTSRVLYDKKILYLQSCMFLLIPNQIYKIVGIIIRYFKSIIKIVGKNKHN